MSNSRYPNIRLTGGRDIYEVEVADIAGYHCETGKPASLATDAEIREAIKTTRRIMQWVTYDNEGYVQRVAVLEAELAWREAFNATVTLPDADLSYFNQWHKKDGTWNPAKHAVYAVRVADQRQGDRYLDLGTGSIGLASSPAHAVRIAQHWQREGWPVEPVIVPCLFSNNESHLPIEEGGR